MQQQIFMQHSFLFVNILVPSRLDEHNDVLSHFFILSSVVLLEQEITQIVFTGWEHFLCSLNIVEKIMDFLRLVYIVIPKLQTNQEKWCFNWKAGGPEPAAGLPPQHDCFVPLKTFSRSTWRKSELSFNYIYKWRNSCSRVREYCTVCWKTSFFFLSFYLWVKRSFVHL